MAFPEVHIAALFLPGRCVSAQHIRPLGLWRSLLHTVVTR